MSLKKRNDCSGCVLSTRDLYLNSSPHGIIQKYKFFYNGVLPISNESKFKADQKPNFSNLNAL